MNRWIPSASSPVVERWRSRAEILKAHLNSLSSEELLRVRPDYWAMRFVAAAALGAGKANFDPNQPRLPAGNPEGGQWTSESGRLNDSRVMSDATPNNDWIPEGRYAAGPRGPRDRSLPLHIPGTGGETVSAYRPGQVTIANDAQTGYSTIDETTENLRKVLEQVVNSRGEGYGPEYGKAIHYDFANAVKSENLRGIEVEQTFPESETWYGKKGTIRTDIVLRNEIGEVAAIYDVKTGDAYLNAARVQELRAKTGVGPDVPIVEMHVRRGLSLKAHRARYSWIITLRLWNPNVRRAADRKAGQNTASWRQ